MEEVKVGEGESRRRKFEKERVEEGKSRRRRKFEKERVGEGGSRKRRSE